MAMSNIGSTHHRWQMEARHAHGRALPPWTRADDGIDEEHDFIVSKRRRLERKIKRDDSPTEHDVEASWISALLKRDYDLPGNSLRESTAVDSPSEASQTASGSTEQTGSPATTTSTTESTTSSSPTTTAYESASESNSDSDQDHIATDDESAYNTGTGTGLASAPGATIVGVNQSNEMIGDLHNNVHKILLGVGTIVCFILLASVLIIAWKLRKRTHSRRRPFILDSSSYNKPSRLDQFLSKIPFVRNRYSRNWSTISDSSRHPYEKYRSTPSPTNNTTTSNTNTNNHRISSQFFGPQKSMGLLSEFGTPRSEFSRSTSTIDSQFIAPGKPVYSSRRTVASKSRTTLDAVSPTSTMFVEDTAVQVRVVSRLAPKEVRLTTFGKPMPPLSPKWATHLKRQTGASDLSSISSGFGDGDIIITSDNTVATINTRVPTQPSPIATPASATSLRSFQGDSTRGISSRQSSMKSGRTPSQRTIGVAAASRHASMRSRRDTVSTVASVESRARFRTVNSWVKQQTGHVRRQQREQADSDAPPVPMLPPPEPELRYMMPDGEEPRRVDQR